jgi:dsRNA-specific ribonuclease
MSAQAVVSSRAYSTGVDDDVIARVSLPKKKDGKSSKRRYVINHGGNWIPLQKGMELPEIKQDFDKNVFRDYIITLLVERGKVTKSEAIKYVDDASLPTFIRALTHDTVNPFDIADNYELLELFGDKIFNECTSWYLRSRFPDILKRGNKGVEIFSKQIAILQSKAYLPKYCEDLGLQKFIRYRELKFIYNPGNKSFDEKIDEVKVKSIVMDRSMKEDTFEAFFAALKEVIDNKEGMVGIGYAVCYAITSSIYDKRTIPYKLIDLKDDKTKLKELFDRRRGDKVVYYDYTQEKNLRADEQVIISEAQKKGLRKDGQITLFIIFNTLPLRLASQVSTPYIMTFGPMSTTITGYDTDHQTNKGIVEQQLAHYSLKFLQSDKFGTEFLIKYSDDM